MNEDYLDNLLNSVLEQEAEDKKENNTEAEMQEATAADMQAEGGKEPGATAADMQAEDAQDSMLSLDALLDGEDTDNAEDVLTDEENGALADLLSSDEEASLEDILSSQGEHTSTSEVEAAIASASESPALAEEPQKEDSDAAVLLEEEEQELFGTDNLNEIEDIQDGDEQMLSSDELDRLSNLELDDIVSDIQADSMSIENLFGDADDQPAEDSLQEVKDSIQEAEDSRREAEDSRREALDSNRTAESAQPDADEAAEMAVLMDKEEISQKKSGRSRKAKKSRKPKKEKKTFFEIVKGIFFEEVGGEETAEPTKAAENENEQLLQDMYGDNIDSSERIEEKEARKKNFFTKFAENMRARKQKIAEEERLEDEAEELEAQEKKEAKEAKKAAALEKKEAAKAEKEAKAKEKKEKPKKEKPKKEKKEKPQKPKKPTDPKDILKIKPKAIIMFISFVAGVVLLITILTSLFTYSTEISSAREYMQNGNYGQAYAVVHGKKLNQKDAELEKQLATIMVVQRQYESYENYKKLGMGTEAVNALIKGLIQYNSYIEQGKELGVDTPMESMHTKILDELANVYKIDSAKADSYVKLYQEDFTKYYKAIETYGGAKNEGSGH